ncbi:MAG: toll/interleukin-1 receptor domain-containing protein [Terriglobia bacterium]
MDIRELLQAIQQGHKPDQETTVRLWDEGLIEVADVTNMQSPGREYIPTLLTAKGLRYLEGKFEESPSHVRSPSETTPVLPANPHRDRDKKKRWDVFISYASEDKEEIARPLAETLRKMGYEVWFDEFSLKLGDSLRRSIDRGLAESRYGVVILSKHFFAKHWPNQELNGLAAIEGEGEEVILPVWHGVAHADVVAYSPPLSDKKAVSTKKGIVCVIEEIAAILNHPIAKASQSKLRQAGENPRTTISRQVTPSFVFVFGAPLGDNDSSTWIMLLLHYGPSTAYNCKVEFFDDDRRNIAHEWLVKHPNTPFPPAEIAGESQKHINIGEAGPEGSIGNFQWIPLDPNRQHYTVNITCREGVLAEKWEVTRVNGVLRTRISIEHGVRWIQRNPGLDPVVFRREDAEFAETPLATEPPKASPRKVHPGWKPNHRFIAPAAIIDSNGYVQVMAGVATPDGSTRTDFGCWDILTKHFGDVPH